MILSKFRYTLAFALGLVFFTACQKETSIENSNNTNGSGVTGDFRAKINGTQWVANQVAKADRAQGLITLMGQSNDGKSLVITLTDSGVHDYVVDENTFNSAAYMTSATAAPLSTNQSNLDSLAGGVVKVTALDTANKKISGTFSFKVYRMTDSAKANITQGVFTNLSYAAAPVTPNPPTTSADTFSVKVDGAQFDVASLTKALNMGTINIMAVSAGGGKSITLLMPATITAGTYPLDGSAGVVATYNTTTMPITAYIFTSGSLVVTSHNTTTRRLRATFSGAATDLTGANPDKQFTQGVIAVTY